MKMIWLLCLGMMCSCSADGDYTGAPIYSIDAGTDAEPIKEEMPPQDDIETGTSSLVDASDQ